MSVLIGSALGVHTGEVSQVCTLGVKEYQSHPRKILPGPGRYFPWVQPILFSSNPLEPKLL